ncbi:MAG: hypothetical protein E7460_08505 [Ruminococcaceae bacterium]|nr:hypothetical protein [Oscillospiraceae bacterium]MBQ8896978.1 hypothetical protein [Clostridia bacterium]
MKEKIYTIPINEAFAEKCGCPLCRLYGISRDKALDYITGAAMMEPDVRTESNKLGFCREHLSYMLTSKKVLPVALMLESHMDEAAKKVYRESKGVLTRAFDPEKLAEKAEKLSSSCFVCTRADREMDHYVRNTVYLWETELDFRTVYAAQEYFCLPHMAALLRFAKKDLSKRELGEFTKVTAEISANYHDKLREELAKFTRSFDYRFAADAKDPRVKASAENTAAYLEGGTK